MSIVLCKKCGAEIDPYKDKRPYMVLPVIEEIWCFDCTTKYFFDVNKKVKVCIAFIGDKKDFQN